MKTISKMNKLTVSKADVEKSSILRKRELRYYMGGYNESGGGSLNWKGNYLACCQPIPAACWVSPSGEGIDWVIVAHCGQAVLYCGPYGSGPQMYCEPNYWY